MQGRARAHVAAHHDWAENVSRYLSVYRHLIVRRANGDLPAAA